MVEGREEAASGRQGLSGQTWGWALRCLCPRECLLCSPLFLSTDTPPPLLPSAVTSLRLPGAGTL